MKTTAEMIDDLHQALWCEESPGLPGPDDVDDQILLAELHTRVAELEANLTAAQASGTKFHGELVDARAALRAVHLTGKDAHTSAIVESVLAECASANAKHGTNDAIPDGTGGDLSETLAASARAACDQAMERGFLTWGLVLREETAEALAERDPAALRAELVQVAAVAMRWIRALDRRASRPAREGTDAHPEAP